MHKNGKWANQIISLQDLEGKWGCFHSLSQFCDAAMTTEQALRRLEILGCTIEDTCIQRAVSYMEDCLVGKRSIPDRREKVTDWDVFTDMILAACIRRFTKECAAANNIATQWAKIVEVAFGDGTYDEVRYQTAYREILKPKYGRINKLSMFYPVSLLQGCLNERTEHYMMQHILSQDAGIYYIYDRKLSILPERFNSRDASRYLAAVELLSEYCTARDHLGFVADWLFANRNENGKWDMGKTVNDKVYFPLSDDWRRVAVREADCTERIEKLLNKLC